MGYGSIAGRARTSSSNPRAHAICDRCGFRYNHTDLSWQFDYAGAGLINQRILVCKPCYDQFQEQKRAIVLPADPVPITQPRLQDFALAETSTEYTSGQNTIDPLTGLPVVGGNVRITQNNDTRVFQQTGAPLGSLNQQPGTDPNAPGDADPGLPYGYIAVPETGPLE